MQALFVDDNKVNRHTASLLLHGFGIDVHAADTGSEAVASFEAHPYDFIFMDCQLLEIDDYKSLNAIKQIRKNKGLEVPIIGVTGSGAQDKAMTVAAYGMDGYLSRPINQAELAELVRHWTNKERKAKGAGESTDQSNLTKASGNALNLELLEKRFNDAGVLELLTLFTKLAPQDLSKIDDAWSRQAFGEIVRLAHNFKGSCATIFAEDLTQTCNELELAARRSDEQSCFVLTKQLGCRLKSALSAIGLRLHQHPK